MEGTSDPPACSIKAAQAAKVKVGISEKRTCEDSVRTQEIKQEKMKGLKEWNKTKVNDSSGIAKEVEANQAFQLRNAR